MIAKFIHSVSRRTLAAAVVFAFFLPVFLLGFVLISYGLMLSKPLLPVSAIQRIAADGRTAEAIAVCRKGLMIFPDERAASFVLGQLYEKSSRYAEAEKIYHGFIRERA